MIIFEILFFAGVALYLFMRLWSVLGTRTGYERKMERDGQDFDADNVIVMPKKKNSQKNSSKNQESASETGEGESYTGPFPLQVQKIRTYIPDFEIEGFEDNAATAYTMIVDAFYKDERAFLKTLVEEPIFIQFTQATQSRKERGETVKNE